MRKCKIQAILKGSKETSVFFFRFAERNFGKLRVSANTARRKITEQLNNNLVLF